MHFLITILLFFCLSSSVFAIPINLHFTPPPRVEIPRVVAGADEATLKTYEIEMAYRITESGDDPFLNHQLGSILYHQGRKDEAQKVWQRSSKQEKNLAGADFMADLEELYALLAAQNGTEAQKKLTDIEQSYTANPHFLLIQGEKAMQSGNFAAAEQSYEKATSLAPQLFVTQLNYARFLDFKGDTKGADTAFKKTLKIAPDNKTVLETYAVFLFKQDRLEDALKMYRKIYNQDNNEPLPEVQLATLSLKLKDNIGARYWYKAAIDSGKGRANAIRASLSDVQMRLGLYDEARENIKVILEEEERLPFLIAMGTIKEARGEFHDAERYYRKALQIEPENVVANNNLAMLLVQTNKSQEEALFFAEKAYHAKPENPMVLGTYGCALYHQGKTQEAKEVLSKALKLSPGDAWARYFYGAIYLKEKQASLAKLHLEGVLIIDPDFVHKDEIKRDLKALQKM